MRKINCFHDILRCGDETLKIVEAFAEHDFCLLRLIETSSANEWKHFILCILFNHKLQKDFCSQHYQCQQ